MVYVNRATEQPNMIFVTSFGMSICINKEEISEMGRAAKGVGAIKLKKGDTVLLAEQSGQNGGLILCMTQKGYAKKTPVSEYELQGRNGKGLLKPLI